MATHHRHARHRHARAVWGLILFVGLSGATAPASLLAQTQQQAQALPPPLYYSASPPPPPPNYYYPDSYAGYYPSVGAYPYGFYGGTPFFGRARHAFPPHAAHYGNQFLPRHSVTIGLAPHGGFARGGGGMGGGRR